MRDRICQGIPLPFFLLYPLTRESRKTALKNFLSNEQTQIHYFKSGTYPNDESLV